MNDQITEKLNAVKRTISETEERCGRKGIKLLAVSKNKTAFAIKAAYEAGQKVFAENYVQEFRQKAEELSGLGIEWHFIGHLQRNKVKYIASIVKCIHSLDSIKLAEEIEKRAESTIDCLIEVNLAGEASKTGISPGETKGLIKAVSSMKKINLTGLMTMPPYDPNPEKSRPYFIKLRGLMNDINNSSIYPRKLTELSMGMTGDLEVAIEEGATIVRVGTGIFGER